MTLAAASYAIEARQAVDKGMDLLDRVAGDEQWVFEISLDDFHLDNPTACIVGKFNHARKISMPGLMWPNAAHAIMRRGGVDPDEHDEYEFGFCHLNEEHREALEEWWKLTIDQRRADLS